MEALKNFDINALIQHYVGGGISLAVVGVLLFYFLFRSRFKTIFALLVGQKTTVDDSSLARYKNRDVIFHNTELLLTRNINILTFVILYFTFMLSLISPILSAIGLASFFVYDTLVKLANYRDFRYFDDIDVTDKFGNWLNKSIAKIDFLSQNLIFFGTSLILLSIVTNSLMIGFLGIFALAIYIIFGLFLLWNIDSYRVNLKIHTYYELLGILDVSLYGNVKIFSIFFVFSAFAFYNNSEISHYLFVLTVLNLLLQAGLKSLLKNENLLAKEHKDIETREYEKVELLSSLANPTSLSRGYKWATPLQVKEFSDRNDEGNSIYLCNYAFYPELVNRTLLRTNPTLLKTLESVRFNMNFNKFVEQIMVLGGAGGGKTTWINNQVNQIHQTNFSKANLLVFNDTKMTFTAQYYREEDYLVSLFDERGAVFCFFTEMKYNTEAGTLFANNLYTTLVGKGEDWFGGQAKQTIARLIQESYYETTNNVDAWNLLFEKFEDLKLFAKKEDDKTTSSMLTVMAIMFDIFSMMRYQICVEKRKILCLYEVVRSKGKQIFFANHENYRKRLTPYLNGVIGAFIGAIMGKKDKNGELIIAYWDEALTLFSQLDDDTINTMLTQTRSKWMANVVLVQTMPKEEIAEKLEASHYAVITFNINGDKAKNLMKKKIGSQKMLGLTMSPVFKEAGKYKEASTEGAGVMSGAIALGNVAIVGMNSFRKGKMVNNKNYSIVEEEILNDMSLQSMPEYHHLVFIPKAEIKEFEELELLRAFRMMAFGNDLSILETSENFMKKQTGVLFLGKTALGEDVNYGNEEFVKWDMRGYYTTNKIESKERFYDSLNEKARFNHYYKLKFLLELNEIDEYCKKHQLDKNDLNELFVEVEENAEKIALFRANFSKDEIKNLADEFYEITDDNERYDFVKKHDLIGCILEGLLVDEVEENE